MILNIQKLDPEVVLPTYAHGHLEDAGLDVYANETTVLYPQEPKAVATGLAVEIPSFYELQVRPRSGLALKAVVTVANSPGTIDPGYRGELKVILLNLGKGPQTIHKGDRIGQLLLKAYIPIEWNVVETLSTSVRGAGGFGSSGR